MLMNAVHPQHNKLKKKDFFFIPQTKSIMPDDYINNREGP